MSGSGASSRVQPSSKSSRFCNSNRPEALVAAPRPRRRSDGRMRSVIASGLWRGSIADRTVAFMTAFPRTNHERIDSAPARVRQDRLTTRQSRPLPRVLLSLFLAALGRAGPGGLAQFGCGLACHQVHQATMGNGGDAAIADAARAELRRDITSLPRKWRRNPSRHVRQYACPALDRSPRRDCVRLRAISPGHANRAPRRALRRSREY